MRTTLALLTVFLVVGTAPAADVTDGMTKGTPALKSATALAFGPSGVLFIGDPQAATIYAVATDDTVPAGRDPVNVEKLGDRIGSLLGVPADQIQIGDVKVNPASGNVYLSVTRGRGADAAPAILKLSRDGKLDEFALKNVPFSKVTIPNANDKQRTLAITSLGYVDGKLIVAGLSNEEFASTLRTIPVPFKDADKGAGIQIFHGAHGKLETQAPVRTFVAYKIGEQENVLAAYTCTPLVKIPVQELKAGAKVKGTTIAELGNRNNPLDMIVYKKDGKDYILMANSARGVMKIPAEHFADATPITARPATEKAGIVYQTIEGLTGVEQLDKLDNDRALLLVKKNGDLSLVTVALP